MTEDAREPGEVADELVARAPSTAWLQDVVAELRTRLQVRELERVLQVWDLSPREAAKAFSVSPQAVSKWRDSGVPRSHISMLAALIAATDELERYVRRERIPDVVRRPVETLGGRSLLEKAQRGQHAELHQVVQEMFDLRRSQP